MILTASLLALSIQVGPNPQTGALQGTPDELLDRPPRRQRDDEPVLSPESAWLSQCLDMLPQEAARAHTLAQLQRNETSGANRVLANHCLGLAATELGLWDDAITAFSAARDESPEDDLRVRARFGTMAGNAALASGSATLAVPLLEQAQSDARGAASATLEALASIDLARALVALDLPEQGLAQLEQAGRLTPDNGEIWLLTATLLRRLERLDEAQNAIERAGALMPRDAQVGLEAGVIAVFSGRSDAARASWQSVIDLAPSGPAAQIARDYISQLGPPTEEAAGESSQ